MKRKARDGGRRRETKPNGCTHQHGGKRKNKKLEAEQPTGWPLTDRQTGSGKNGADHSPYRWRQRSAPQPWVQRSCASPAGRRMLPGPKRGRAETKERRDKEKEERDSAAPNVIMQWTGSANGGGAGCFVFLFFSRWGDAAACVARAQLRGGAPVQGNLWKAHTHRSGQGGCMLENSGLVLGVDSSFGLLTWLDNPRHVGMALLVHRRLLHLR